MILWLFLLIFSNFAFSAGESCFAPMGETVELAPLGSFRIKEFSATALAIPVFNYELDMSKYIDEKDYSLKATVSLKDLLDLALAYDKLLYGTDVAWALEGTGYATGTLKIFRNDSNFYEQLVILANNLIIPASGIKSDVKGESGQVINYRLTLDGNEASSTVRLPSDISALSNCLLGKENIADFKMNLRIEQNQKGKTERLRWGTLNVDIKDRKINSSFIFTIDDVKSLEAVPDQINGVNISKYTAGQVLYKQDFDPQNCQDFKTQTAVKKKSFISEVIPTVVGEDFKVGLKWDTEADSGKNEDFVIKRTKLPKDAKADDDIDWSASSNVHKEKVHSISSTGSSYSAEDTIPNNDSIEDFGTYAYGLFYKDKKVQSNVVTISRPTYSFGVTSIYPNPVEQQSTSEIGMVFSNDQPVQVVFQLVDMQGQVLGEYKPSEEFPKGKENKVAIPLNQLNAINLAPGIYILKINYVGKINSKQTSNPPSQRLVIK